MELVGDLIFAMQVKKSVVPSENDPLRDIQIRDTVGAPPLVLFNSRHCWLDIGCYLRITKYDITFEFDL